MTDKTKVREAGEAPDQLTGLLPCPSNCGQQAFVTTVPAGFGSRVRIVQCQCGWRTSGFDLSEDAIEMWNTRASQWQGIETAPKMRKLIVGYFNPLGNWRSVMTQYWLEGELESDTDESGFAPEGWYEATEAYEYLMPCDQQPEFWVELLPAPPKSTG